MKLPVIKCENMKLQKPILAEGELSQIWYTFCFVHPAYAPKRLRYDIFAF